MGDAPVRRRIALPARIDLARTAGVGRIGASDPTLQLDQGSVWRAIRTPDGPATLHLAPTSDPRGVDATAWGPGAEWALEQAPTLSGADDDLTSFDPSPHPVVADLARRKRHVRLGATGRALDALIPTILGQKVTGHESAESYRRLVWAHGEPAPGPRRLMSRADRRGDQASTASLSPSGEASLDEPRGPTICLSAPILRVPPAPDRLLTLGYAGFHRFGVERRRAETILHACRHADAIERAARSGPAALTERLQAMPGIGPWTEASVRQVALGDPDAVPVGDFNFPGHVAWALAGERTADDARMLELLAPFSGHRGRVLRLITSGTRKPPRHGPRQRVRSFAHF